MRLTQFLSPKVEKKFPQYLPVYLQLKPILEKKPKEHSNKLGWKIKPHF